MAPEDVKGKKRKGATDAAPKPKKQKKSDESATHKKAPAKALKASVDPDDVAPIPVEATRKQAEDFFDETTETVKEKKSKKKGKTAEDANGDVESVLVEQKQKKVKKVKTTNADVVPTAEAPAQVPKEKEKKPKKAKQSGETEEALVKKTKKAKSIPGDDEPITGGNKKAKKGKASKKQKEEVNEANEEVIEAKLDEGEEGEDDQTAALLAGFETDSDESDLEKEDEDFDPDKLKDEVPKGILKKLSKVKQNEDTPGVIFVGRIPHGFYEPQMKAYFSQFGTVTRLRVSRNKKTGASKHYAFVEFASAEVADIVAKTMDKYLMFGHILQCRVIPPEQVHASLFVGANQRFKRHPRNKIAGAEMARGADRAVWEKRVVKEIKRRQGKNKQLKEALGYEFNSPALKSVGDVPKKAPALEDASAQQLLLEASVGEAAGVVHTESKPGQLSVTETVKVKKSKKGAKDKAAPDMAEVTEKVEVVTEEKSNKDKKRKVDTIVESKSEEKATRGPSVKKAKKGDKTIEASEAVAKEKKRKATPADQSEGKVKKTKKAKA